MARIINPITYSFGQNSHSSTKIYGGVKCTVSYSKEKFYNSLIERDFIVYTTDKGTKFFFPKDLNFDLQTMSPQMAISVWSDLPEPLIKLSQNKIVFLDICNPDDNYWGKLYENFTQSYATGGQEIIFWRYSETHQKNYVKHTYCHEIGHFIDDKAGGYSSGLEWLTAMKNDKKNIRIRVGYALWQKFFFRRFCR